jgi:hypothetical protein
MGAVQLTLLRSGGPPALLPARQTAGGKIAFNGDLGLSSDGSRGAAAAYTVIYLAARTRRSRHRRAGVLGNLPATASAVRIAYFLPSACFLTVDAILCCPAMLRAGGRNG